MKYVVDTHVLLWFLSGRSQPGQKAKAILDDPKSNLVLPAIVLAEAVWIVRNREAPAITVESLLASINEDKRIEIYSLNRAVIKCTVGLLAINEMHDRQIVATALVIADGAEKVALLTCDLNITKSNIVSTLWW